MRSVVVKLRVVAYHASTWARGGEPSPERRQIIRMDESKTPHAGLDLDHELRERGRETVLSG